MWKDYFSFNKRQRNGIFVLLTLIAGMMTYLIIADYSAPSPANINFSSFKNDIANHKTVSAGTSKQIPLGVPNNSKHTTIIDINSADSATLMSLPQVTPKLARTIVRFRDALGGYYNKQQLLEVYGMDEACYNAIANSVSADSTKVDKLDLNTATEKDLSHHPYIHKKLAKAIIDYRKANGPFKKINDILKVDGIDNDKYAKLASYLTIGE